MSVSDSYFTSEDTGKPVNTNQGIEGTARLLIVEDEDELREMLCFALNEKHYDITATGDGRSAWQELIHHEYNLVLLDWMLPDITGIEILRRMRQEPTLSDIPVIMLTARSDEFDRVRGLETGADDYVVKPFSISELRARIRTRLRHVRRKKTGLFSVDGLTLNAESHRTTVNGKAIDLGPTEFRLLRHFMSTPERVFSRAQLLDAVWGTNVFIEERTVDVHIRRLRKVLEPYGKSWLIQTVRGTGYRFSSRI